MRLFLFGLAVCAVLAGMLARAPARDALHAMRAELQRLEREVAALRERNRELARRAHFLRHDPVALEQVARHRYGLVRADEWVLQPAPTSEAAKPAGVPSSAHPALVPLTTVARSR
jgi:cell division protein FtsB